MTKQEWLDMGIEKGIVDLDDCELIKFSEAYSEWLKMKMTFIRPQTIDRIDVTYTRHYANTELADKHINKITDECIIEFLLMCCSREKMTLREMSRIMQIIKGVLVFMRDIKRGGVPLHDWEKVKRNIPLDKMEVDNKKEYVVNKADIETLMHEVVENKIYYEKQSACLSLCMNFFLGLRIGELAALDFKDFDLERGVVSIWKTETKYYNRDEDGKKSGTMVYRVVDTTKTVYSVREVPILPEVRYLYDELRKHHKEMGYKSTKICYDGKETVLVRSLDRTLRRLQALCGVRQFKTHEIRKSFATIMHYKGVPTRVISDLLGHSEIGTTENCYILSYENAYKEYYEYMRKALIYEIK